MISGVEESCDEVRRRASTQGAGAALPAPVRDHVLACPACADWLAAQSAASFNLQPPASSLLPFVPSATPGPRPTRWLPPLAALVLAWALVAFGLPGMMRHPTDVWLCWDLSRALPPQKLVDAAIAEWKAAGIAVELEELLGRPLDGGAPLPGSRLTVQPGARPDMWARVQTRERVEAKLTKCTPASRLLWLELAQPMGDGQHELRNRLVRTLLDDTRGTHSAARLVTLELAVACGDLTYEQRKAVCAEALDERWGLIRAKLRRPIERLRLPDDPYGGFCYESACSRLRHFRNSRVDFVVLLVTARLEHAREASGWAGVWSILRSPLWRPAVQLLITQRVCMVLPLALIGLLIWVGLVALRHGAEIAAALRAGTERDRARGSGLLAVLMAGLVQLPLWCGGLAWWAVFPGSSGTDLASCVLDGLSLRGEGPFGEAPNAELILLFAAMVALCFGVELVHRKLVTWADPTRAPGGWAGGLLVPITLFTFTSSVESDQGSFGVPLIFAAAVLLVGRMLAPALGPRDRLFGARAVVAALALAGLTALGAGFGQLDTQRRAQLEWVGVLWAFGLALPAAAGYVRAHLTPADVRRTRFLVAALMLMTPVTLLVLFARTAVGPIDVAPPPYELALLVALAAAVSWAAHATGVRMASPLAGAVAPVKAPGRVVRWSRWIDGRVGLAAWLVLIAGACAYVLWTLNDWA